MKVTKTPTNNFVASIPSRPEIAPVEAASQASAVAGLKKAVDQAVKSSSLKKG